MSAPSHTAKTYAPAAGGAPAPSTGDFAVYADDAAVESTAYGLTVKPGI
jgi:hypothetical protein